MVDFVVTTLADEFDLGATQANPRGSGFSLREALALANSTPGADNITFAPGLAGGTTPGVDDGDLVLTQGMLTIFDAVTIRGDVNGDSRADITIDANSASRVFDVNTHGASTLDALVITGGRHTSVGNNLAFGGGVLDRGGGTLTVTNSTITGNSLMGQFAEGAGVFVYFGSGLVITNSAVTHNTASGTYAVGGGIWVEHNAHLTAVGVTLSDNEAMYSGGLGNNGTAVLTGSTISDNHAEFGAGVRNYAAITFVNTTIADNIATMNGGGFSNGLTTAQATFINSTVAGNYAHGSGGGLRNAQGSVTVTNSIVAGNHAGVSGNDFSQLPTNTSSAFHGLNLFSHADVSDPSVVVETDLTRIFEVLATIDPDGVAASGDEFRSGLLADNGGPVRTIAILPGGAADGAGDNNQLPPDTLDLDHDGNTAEALPIDARGSARIAGARVDIGAFEHSAIAGTQGDDSFTAPAGAAWIDALGGTDTISFGFKLTDATVSWVGNEVIVDGPNSHTVLTGFEIFQFTDGTVHNDDADPLVDDLFYYARNHDVWAAHADADAHYHQSGWHEGRDPNAFFSTLIYLSANPEVRAAGIDPLVHFDQTGWREGRVPSIAFDPARYLALNPDVAAAHVDPLAHFLQSGAGEGRRPFALAALFAANGFDYVYYLQHNPDVAAAGVDPFLHFEATGWKEGRNPNALFDVNGYLANYADVAAAHVNPLDHYHQTGWHEGRDPSVNFDTTSYLSAYPDIAAAQVDPLLHYLQTGIHEGRSAFADGVWS